MSKRKVSGISTLCRDKKLLGRQMALHLTLKRYVDRRVKCFSKIVSVVKINFISYNFQLFNLIII